MVVPNAGRVSSYDLGCVGSGLEVLVGHQPLVALDRLVVAGRVDTPALVPGDERAGRTAECLRGVVCTVVRDQAHDPGDAVRGEEQSRRVEERDGRRGILVLKCLGVGQAGNAIGSTEGFG